MKNKKFIGKIIDFLLNVLIVLLSIFLLVSLYTAVQVRFLGNEYANFFGYSLFEVQTGSMHGTIEAGDWIIVQTTKDVSRGDIITYKHGNDFVTHRVIEIYKGSYVTKGDANNTKDNPIDREQVVGKVVKILSGFGIVKRILFNPVVIIFLIICLYLFNLTFKNGKSEFDKKIEKIINKLKSKLLHKDISEDNNVPLDSLLDTSTPIEKVEESAEVVEESTEVVEKSDEKPIAELIQDDSKEEELSKTAMFRMIDIDSENVPEEIENNVVEQPVEDEDDKFGKTSLYRIISVDDDDDDFVENNVTPQVEEKPKKEKIKKEKKIRVQAEKIVVKEKKKNITKDYISEKIKNKKAKNVLDKAFVIKKIMYDEIIDVLLENEKAYIIKSPFRKMFMEQYMNYKYFGLDSDRDNLTKLMNSFYEELRRKNIRDENKTNALDIYHKTFIFINNIENKSSNTSYKKEISSFKKCDNDKLEEMELDISNIVKYSSDNLSEILEKLESNTFKDQYKKISGQRNLYGVLLNHNIAFSRVYSNYIVDKTYTEGIVAEDKIAVLLNLLLCKITNDIMNRDYDSKYVVYVPEALYEKDKKLDKIMSIIDNDYAKSHIFVLTDSTNVISNAEKINRLSKKGYHFAISFSKPMKYNSKQMGYIYLADYYFIDTDASYDDICKNIPKELVDKIIIDSLDKKIGDYKGD